MGVRHRVGQVQLEAEPQSRWWFPELRQRRKKGAGVVELGRAWGWNGEECVQEMQPEPKGTIPTTAAQLCQR